MPKAKEKKILQKKGVETFSQGVGPKKKILFVNPSLWTEKKIILAPAERKKIFLNPFWWPEKNSFSYQGSAERKRKSSHEDSL